MKWLLGGELVELNTDALIALLDRFRSEGIQNCGDMIIDIDLRVISFLILLLR